MKKDILLVEDSPLNRDLIVQLLEEKYSIREAGDGDEGIHMALQKKPDLIIMDLSLPIVDGWEAIKRIKANPTLSAIPLVTLTAHAMQGDRERVMSLGCDAYLTKPLDEKLLFEAVGKLLNRKS